MDPVADDAIDKRLQDLARQQLKVTAIGCHATAMHALVCFMHLACSQVAVDLQLIGSVVVSVSVLSLLVCSEVGCQLTICKYPQSQILEARWAQVFHLISLKIVVKLSPIRSPNFISLFDIDVVRMHVGGQHHLRIKVKDHKRWVLEVICSYTTSNGSHNNWFLGISHAIGKLVRLVVSMTSNAKPHNILESLHQGSVANSKLVLAVHWSVMSNHDCQAFGCLNFHELLLEPGKLMAWVVTLSPDVEVEHIACVCVECNHL